MLQQLYVIGRNTFTESIRQPIYLVLILLGMLALLMNPALAAYTLTNDNQLMIDMGLSVLLVVGLLLAAFTATRVVSAEIDSRTVLTVISKPVKRPVFVVGKFLGVAGAIVAAYWVLALFFLLSVRHGVLQTASQHFDGPVLVFGGAAVAGAMLIATAGNYLYRWTFTSMVVGALVVALPIAWLLVLVVNHEWQWQSIATEFRIPESQYKGVNLRQVLIAVGMALQAVLVLVAVAIAASTRLRQLMTLLVCVAAFLLGMLNDSLLTPWLKQNPWREVGGVGEGLRKGVGELLHALAPNFQIFWVADAIKMANDVPAAVSVTVTAYALLYIGAALAVAVALFQSREVG